MTARRGGATAALLAAAAATAALLAGSPAGAKEPPREPPSPDLGFYVRRVAPFVDTACASCHRSGAGGLVLGPAGSGAEAVPARARELAALARFVDREAPWDSRLLRKVIGEDRGGLPHGGGALVSPDDDAYDDLLDLASGATLSNLPPEPVPGKDRRGKPGDEVALDGSLSYDRDDDPLTFRWDLSVRPAGSKAELRDPDARATRFTADVPGTYVARLRVSDGKAWSAARVVVVEALDRVGPEAPDAVESSGLDKVDPAALRIVRAVYGATLGRPPTPKEAIAAAGKAPAEVGATLLSTVEAARAWVEDECLRLGVVGDFAPPAERVEALEGRIAAGTIGPADATVALALLDAFARAHPEPATLAAAADLFGASPTAIEEAARLVHDGPAFLADRPEARRAAMRRYAERYVAPDAAAAIPGARSGESFTASASSLLSSPEFAAAARAPRPATDAAFARAAFADLLGRRPTAAEAAAVARAVGTIPGSTAGRAAVVAVLLDSGEVALPLVVQIPDRAAWVADRFLRYVGRAPTTAEAAAYGSALVDPDGGPALVVRALLTSREYASR